MKPTCHDVYRFAKSKSEQPRPFEVGVEMTMGVTISLPRSNRLLELIHLARDRVARLARQKSGVRVSMPKRAASVAASASPVEESRSSYC